MGVLGAVGGAVDDVTIQINGSLTSVRKATPRREVRRGIPNRYIFLSSIDIYYVGRSYDSASPDPDLEKLSRTMSHSLPSLNIDAGGSITGAEGAAIEGTYVNGGHELCAVLGNVETLFSASFTGSIYMLVLRIVSPAHLY